MALAKPYNKVTEYGALAANFASQYAFIQVFIHPGSYSSGFLTI